MDHRTLIAQSLEELRLKTGVHDRVWQLGEADWSVDQDTGEIVFSTPNGRTATCAVQIIGTFNTEDSTWLWGWDHPSVQPELAAHAERVRQYGENNSIDELTTRKLSATEEQCWEFTALACKLNEAQGGYRGPAGSALVFMTFGEPRLSHPGPHDDDAQDTEPADAGDFATEVPPEVRVRVEGFIQALHDWEVAAFEEYENNESSDSAAARSSYAALISKWCVPGTITQPIAFGGDPKHGLDAEQITGAALDGDRCRVRTQHSSQHGFKSVYEYHLQRINGDWLFEQVYYVDDGEMFEML